MAHLLQLISLECWHIANSSIADKQLVKIAYSWHTRFA